MFTYRRILQAAPSLKPIIYDPKRTSELANIAQKVSQCAYMRAYIELTNVR